MHNRRPHPLSLALSLWAAVVCVQARLGDMRTVYVVPNPYVGVGYEHGYDDLGHDGHMWTRKIDFLLNVAPGYELGIQVPVINSVQKNSPETDRVGDVVVHFSKASTLFKDAFVMNWIFSWNFGTGKSFRDSSTHPMESYGHEEFRWGVVFLRSWGKWSLLGDVQYYFRARNDQDDFFRGFTLNIFNGDAWKRWFGLNPNRRENFFYREKIKNDNLVYKIGVNQYHTYPFTIFAYLDFRHDFYSDSEFGTVETKRAPGVFSEPLWLYLGTKYLLDNEETQFALVGRVALNPDARDYHNFGLAIGGYLEF